MLKAKNNNPRWIIIHELCFIMCFSRAPKPQPRRTQLMTELTFTYRANITNCRRARYICTSIWSISSFAYTALAAAADPMLLLLRRLSRQRKRYADLGLLRTLQTHAAVRQTGRWQEGKRQEGGRVGEQASKQASKRTYWRIFTRRAGLVGLMSRIST